MTRAIPAEFSRWLETRESGVKGRIDGADVSEVDLSDVDMLEAWLFKCVFDSAVLREAELSRSFLSECSFRDADLTSARLVKAQSYGSTFERALLRESNLMRLYADDSNFRAADLTGAHLLRFTASDCDLREASLRRCHFEKTMIEDCILTGADLEAASGTINGGLRINVGTPEAPIVLEAYAALEWMRAAGADLSWSHTPEEVARRMAPNRDAPEEPSNGPAP